MTEDLIYESPGRSAGDVQQIIDELIEQSKHDDALGSEVRKRGIDPSTLTSDSIRVQAKASGIDPTIVDLIIVVASYPLKDVWREVFLPKIKRRWGQDIVGKEKGASKD